MFSNLKDKLKDVYDGVFEVVIRILDFVKGYVQYVLVSFLLIKEKFYKKIEVKKLKDIDIGIEDEVSVILKDFFIQIVESLVLLFYNLIVEFELRYRLIFLFKLENVQN